MVEQYNSEFSARIENRELDNELMGDEGDDDLTDIEVSENSIVEAIGELAANSAAGCDGIPALLLIKTKNTVAVPLKLILRKSLDEGKIHEMYKMAYGMPIHKRGSKLKPERYRPVSLTSHIMKVFERVVKRDIMAHLIQNQFNKPRTARFCAW